MPENEYTPTEALKMLIRKAAEFDNELGETIKRAVAEGKDVQETEPSPARGRKGRKFRKATPYSDEEALEAALSVFRAALVEIPHVANTSLDEFAKATVDEEPAELELKSDNVEFFGAASEKEPRRRLHLRDAPKEVIIDMTVETQLEADKRDDVQMPRTSEEQLTSLDDTFANLRRLTTFPD